MRRNTLEKIVRHRHYNLTPTRNPHHREAIDIGKGQGDQNYIAPPTAYQVAIDIVSPG
jgi:hypothetical protein